MFVVVNMETRKVLTYAAGDRRVYGCEDIAKDHAAYAQTFKGHPHQVLHISNVVIDSLGRERAPWVH